MAAVDLAAIVNVVSTNPVGLSIGWYWFTGMLILTVDSSSRVAILSVPGVPPVLLLYESSGTTNQNSVSIWASVLAGKSQKNRMKVP